MIHYFIANMTDITDDMFASSIHTNPLELRRSLDKTKVAIKFEYAYVPYSLVAKGCGPYTKTEMHELMSTSAWEDPEGIN